MLFRSKVALGAALDAARETPAAPVPLHIRNAPTGLMKELGYGAEYLYAHNFPGHYVRQAYLPERVAGREPYAPGSLGYEKRVGERLAWWRKLADEGRASGEERGGD